MPRAKPVPISRGLLISCLRHMKLGIVAKTHGGIWVRKQAHKQIRCDREAREIFANGWAYESPETTPTGQPITIARTTADGDAAIEAHLLGRAA